MLGLPSLPNMKVSVLIEVLCSFAFPKDSRKLRFRGRILSPFTAI
jgi:hypothetical protein